MKKIGIIGGGLAGLVSAILLARKGFEITLFEEKRYPFHRVCGEYISNEVIPFLKEHGLYPTELKPVDITDFQLTSASGKALTLPLDLGGFGISRYRFDEWLSRIALEAGVKIIHDRVTSCEFAEEVFEVATRDSGESIFDLVIGSFGKRSTLDKHLQRPFISKRSPYVGVKYHLKTSVADPKYIALHNFRGGYCGISRVEEGRYNLCYLSSRDNLKKHGSIPSMEENVLMGNPYLREIFEKSEFLFEKPLVINEITFSSKEPVFRHILMTGDSAGMITPLCGNGMAMAIHSARILCELIENNVANGFDRSQLELDHAQSWRKQFSRRLWAGRKIQSLFGGSALSELAVGFGRSFPPFTRKLMSRTHGQPFS